VSGWRASLLVAALIAGVAGPTGVARAQTEVGTGPAIALERTDLSLGQGVVVTLTGWTSRTVTLAVCGNLALRGAADCNMVASQAVGLVNIPAPSLTELFVAAPPGSCPCVVRASSTTQREVATVPIDLAGVPVGPVVAPAVGDLVAVSVDVRAADRGFVAAARSTLAGPADYRVTVTVGNLSPETLSDVSLYGSAGRSRIDDAVSFDIPPPGAIAPGQTWAHEVDVTLPAPVLRRFTWRVIASGAGPLVEAEHTMRRLPLGLAVAAALFVADVVAIACRTTLRRRDRRRQSQAPPVAEPPVPVPDDRTPDDRAPDDPAPDDLAPDDRAAMPAMGSGAPLGAGSTWGPGR